MTELKLLMPHLSLSLSRLSQSFTVSNPFSFKHRCAVVCHNLTYRIDAISYANFNLGGLMDSIEKFRMLRTL